MAGRSQRAERGNRPVPTRRASRVRGEKTRRKIVAAAQRVIARDGVRAVSHRVVAREAGVNLSLTTYYFVDLYDLIAAAFGAFSDGGQNDLREEWARGFRYLARIAPLPLSSAPLAVRKRVRDYALKRICEHVQRKVSAESIWLAIEHQFFFAALNDPRLVQMAAAHRARLIEPLVDLFRLFGSPQAAVDADLLFGTIIRLEYEALLHDTHDGDFRRVRREVRRLLDLMLGLAARR